MTDELYELLREGYQSYEIDSIRISFQIRVYLGHDDAFIPLLNFDEASRYIVILFVSNEIVINTSWLQAVLKLQKEIQDAAQSGKIISLLPIAIDTSAYNLTPIYRNHNPLRLTHLKETISRKAVLRRAVLEVAARTLLAKDANEDADSAMRVFISHAKLDGQAIAEQCRDSIRQFAQLIPWYDSNDLGLSQNWTKQIEEAMHTRTAGMIAIMTSSYAEREWTKRELQTARTPREIKTTRQPGGDCSRVFVVQPVVAVVSLGRGWSRGLACVAGVPCVGWLNDAPLDSIEQIIDEMLGSILRHQLARATAVRIAEQVKDPNTCFITWTPDVWTISKLTNEVVGIKLGTETSNAVGPACGDQRPLTIVYPGRKLTPDDREEIESHLRGFQWGIRLVSYHEWEKEQYRQLSELDGNAEKFTISDKPLLIGVTTGGGMRELAQEGLLPSHVDEILLDILSVILGLGHRLAVGQLLNNRLPKLAGAVIDATKRLIKYNHHYQSRLASSTYLVDRASWPLVNYSVFPFYNDISVEDEAQLIGLCQHKRVVPQKSLDYADQIVGSNAVLARPEIAKINADLFSLMRETAAAECDLRIVLGGKVNLSFGWMPGILEEVGYSLQQKKPILILGALGGCARLIAQFLVDQYCDWPYSLSLESCAYPSRDAWLSGEERNQLQQRFERYKSLLRDYREELHGTQSMIRGVDRKLLLSALHPNLDTTQILFHVEQFIHEVERSRGA